MQPVDPAFGNTPSVLGAAVLPPILIVDDDPDAIFLLRRALQAGGVEHPVVAFDDSADALDFLRGFTEEAVTAAAKPCVMFLDIKMPKVHGFVLLKWVRQQPVFDDMYVVMVSGSEEPEDRLRAGKLGADRYLVKYPPPATLAQAIAAAQRVARAG